jgi:hypothetical protein
MDECVDHKDMDPEYRRTVLASVQETYGPLTPILDRSELIGIWTRSYAPDVVFQLQEDGTVIATDVPDRSRTKWKFENGIFHELYWTDPMPEYGITEGSWDQISYHCMKDKRGRIVMWNGDSSMLFNMQAVFEAA